MIARSNFDQLLIFVFFAIAIFFQILTKAASKGRRRPPDTRRRTPSQESRPLMSESDETDEERVRKFLEALGQPTTSEPPPAVEPRPTYRRPLTHVPPFGSPLPPLTTRPPDLPKAPVRPTIASKREVKVVRPRVAEAPKFEVHQGPPPITEGEVHEAFEPAKSADISRKPGTKIDLAVLLKSTSGLRNAIILREVFGPPRSMQPLDLVESG